MANQNQSSMWKNIVIVVLVILIVVVLLFGKNIACNSTDKSAAVDSAKVEKAITDSTQIDPSDPCKKAKDRKRTGKTVGTTIYVVVKDLRSPQQVVAPTVNPPQPNPDKYVPQIVAPNNTSTGKLMATNTNNQPIEITFRLGRDEMLWVPDQWIRYEGTTYSNQVDNKHQSWNWQFPIGGEVDQPVGISGRLKDGRNFVRADQIDKYLINCNEQVVESWCNYDRGLRECSKQVFDGVEYYVNSK